MELSEHEQYMDMLELQINLADQGRSMFDLTNLEIQNLGQIAQNSNSTAGSWAKGILSSFSGQNFCNCVSASENSYKNSAPADMGSVTKLMDVSMDVQPNPAAEWTSFIYNLPENATTAVVKISDNEGKIIDSFTISGHRGQKVWDTRNKKSGVYYYTLTVNGTVTTGKLVIK